MGPASPEPRYFGPEDRPLFGWAHPAPPSAAPSPLGVVVCNPFGYEAICAHRSLRAFASAIAEAGIPSLRFDYDGTGDSAGDDRDPGRVKAWVDSIHHAIDELRRVSGVREVVLLGVRLGALLAAVAAADREDVSGLVAIAPVLSGKHHVRELRVLQAALALREAPFPRGPVDVQEAVGFALTEETQRSLSGIDLASQDRRAPRSVLILDRPDLPGKPAWAQRLAAGGADVDVRQVAGYVEMTRDPHRVVVPQAMIDEAIGWLRGLAPRAGGGPGVTGARTPRASGRFGDVVERIVFPDEAAGLFGVVTGPTGAAETGTGVLLLNAGAIHHIGPNRLHVDLARLWAAAGHVVLRLDLSGIGDSPARAGEPDNVVYGPRALDDVAAALRFLRRQPGVHEVRVVGLCAGAYHAFKSAVAGHGVDAVIAINPLTFFWKEGDALDHAPHRLVETTERHRKALFSVEKWKKVLRGEVDVRAAVATMARHGASRLVDRARDASRRAGFPLAGDLGAELEAVARRGIDLRFVLAADDPGLSLLRGKGGTAFAQLRRRGAVDVTVIDGPDHTFTALWSQESLRAVLTRALAEPIARRSRD